jgi:GDPmannose 4,6-dehydratase
MSCPKNIALITGINGQDGSYLAELLLSKGYEVHGLVRRTSQFSRSRIEAIQRLARDRGQCFTLHYGDLSDTSSLHFVIEGTRPTEIYNLASLSHVQISEGQPEYTTEINANAVLRLLEAAKHYTPNTRFYQAGSSELFGKSSETPQAETTPFRPRSVYGVAKQYGFWIAKHYRESHGMHVSNGIMYNHESPRRGENFVTRKITYSLARIRAGLQDQLELGNLDARRDWGYAKDYVEIMWRMLQEDTPDDYIIASGQTHSVREFVEEAAHVAGIALAWAGAGRDEIGVDQASGKTVVTVNPRYYRPNEDHLLVGDASKARRVLGWRPGTKFDELVKIMMQADLDNVSVAL